MENLRDVPLTKGKKLVRLQAENADAAVSVLQNYPGELVEMKLILTSPLTSADAAKLAECSNLVSLVTEVRAEHELELESRKGLSDEELFDSFYRSAYNAEPRAELKTLFLATLSELEN